MIAEVDRIHCPSKEEFSKRYLEPGIPVLIEGVASDWQASNSWTPEYLADEYGNRDVPIVVLRDGDYLNSEQQEIPLQEYLQKIGAFEEPGSSENSDNTDSSFYLAQVSVDQYFPEMRKDISMPDFFDKEAPGVTTMYAGSIPFSQLHYHPNGSAMLGVVYGKKRVRLYAPDQGKYLYPGSVFSSAPHFSVTHQKVPDPDEFPKFSQAEFVEVTVSAGEILFFPIYYWHSIENIGLSISVTSFWSRSWKSRFLPPPGPRSVYFYEPVKQVMRFGKKVITKAGLVAGLIQTK